MMLGDMLPALVLNDKGEIGFLHVREDKNNTWSFLSNTYLGNAGNLGLGLNMVHWLSHDDAALNIRIKSAPDTSLVLGKVAQAVIGLGFLIGLPVLLLVTGILIWLLRRRR